MKASPASWAPLPSNWRVAGNAVDVVRVEVPAVRAEAGRFTSILSEAEKARAGRFRLAADLERYVVARGVLRTLLSRALPALGGSPGPSDIVIEKGPWGKPFAPEWPALSFNVSHSADVVLVAFALGREVGVDVEHAHSAVMVADLVPVVLGHEERAWWERVPPHEQHAAFFALWTRREALSKAAGTGLGRTDIPWSEAASATEPSENLMNGRVWTVYPFEAASGYPAAVAVEGTGGGLRTWGFRPQNG